MALKVMIQFFLSCCLSVCAFYRLEMRLSATCPHALIWAKCARWKWSTNLKLFMMIICLLHATVSSPNWSEKDAFQDVFVNESDTESLTHTHSSVSSQLTRQMNGSLPLDLSLICLFRAKKNDWFERDIEMESMNWSQQPINQLFMTKSEMFF